MAQSTKSEKYDDDLRKTKAALQSRYRRTLPYHLRGIGNEKPLSLEKHFSSLQVIQPNSQTGGTSKSSIGIKEMVQCNNHSKQLLEKFKKILKKNQNSSPISPRILVQGEMGFGKSTLTKKIAMDWAQEKSYLKRYQLVFLILEAEIKKFDTDLLKKQVPGNKLDDEAFQDLMSKYEEKILLIVDGYNELATDENMKQLLEGKTFPKMTVIITALPYVHITVELNLICNIPVISDSKKPPENVGVNTTGKPFDQDTLKKFMEEHMRCMLLWSLLQYMPQESLNNTPIPITKTAIFKYFFNLKVRNTLISNQLLSPSTDLNIFSLHKEHQPPFLGRLFQFGQFVQREALKDNGRRNFTEEEILEIVRNDKKIFEIGILMPSLQCEPREKRYSPVHVSFLEFLAAYNVWRKIKAPGANDTLENQMDSFVNVISPIRYSFFYGFLAGLLGREGSRVFSILHEKRIFNETSAKVEEVQNAIFYIVSELQYLPEIQNKIQEILEEIKK